MDNLFYIKRQRRKENEKSQNPFDTGIKCIYLGEFCEWILNNGIFDIENN